MNYLLDTNVISEVIRSVPQSSVIEWFNQVPSDRLFLSVLTIGEIRKGVEKLESTTKKEKLKIWLEVDLPAWFKNRILAINLEVAERWGRLQHQMQRPIPAIDSLLAATALHYDMCIVTRNEQDFKYPALEVVNPFKNSSSNSS